MMEVAIEVVMQEYINYLRFEKNLPPLCTWFQNFVAMQTELVCSFINPNSLLYPIYMGYTP